MQVVGHIAPARKLPLPAATAVEINGDSAIVENVIIYPQFSAVGIMIEWFKSEETGFDISGYLKFGNGEIQIGESNERVNSLLTTDTSTVENNSQLFDGSGSIFFSGGLLRLSYLGEFLEFSAAGKWRILVPVQEFNGSPPDKPISVDVITSFELLYVF